MDLQVSEPRHSLQMEREANKRRDPDRGDLSKNSGKKDSGPKVHLVGDLLNHTDVWRHPVATAEWHLVL